MDSPPPLPQESSREAGNLRLLGNLFFLELALGLAWSLYRISYLLKDDTYGSISLFGIVAPIFLLCMLAAVISLFRFPANLKAAVLVLSLPFFLSLVPVLINAATGSQPLLATEKSLQTAVLIIVAVFVLAILLLPKRFAFFLPAFVIKSFWINLLFLLTPLLVYATGALALFQWTRLFSQASDDKAGYVLAYGLMFAILFAMITVVPAGIISLYSYLSFFQKHETRRLGMRISQLVLSLPATGFGVWLLIRLLREMSVQ